jgi:hypothetical protein
MVTPHQDSNKRGPKRTKEQRAYDLRRVAKLSRCGYTWPEIAEQCGVSIQQIGYDMKQIRAQHKVETDRELDEMRAEMEMQYKDIQREAWKALQLSKQGEQVPCSLCEGKGKGTCRSKRPVKCWRCEGKGYWVKRTPIAADLLRILLQCLKGLKDLRGADAPKKSDVRKLTLDWKALQEQMPPIDAIERELQALLPSPQSETSEGQEAEQIQDGSQRSVLPGPRRPL